MSKQTEMLKMIAEQYDNQIKLLDSCKHILETSPEGCLYVDRRLKKPRFTWITSEADRRKRAYIDKGSEEGRELIAALADKSTAKYAIPRLRENVKLLGKLLEKYRAYDPLAAPFGKFSTGAVYLRDDICLEEWKRETWYANVSFEEHLIHDTKAGHKVRSKSEVLIADSLFDRGVSYRYDCSFSGGGKTVYPDFEIVRPRDREIIIWEHLGRIDLPEYTEKIIEKLVVYGQRGFSPGKNLILTKETLAAPLTHEIIDRELAAFGIAGPEVDKENNIC